MNKRFRILVAGMLKSTSLINRARYTKEKKVKNRAIGAMIGMFFLYAMMMGYFFASCIGLGVMGLQEAIPEMCAISVSAVAFLFSVFKVNGYLFNFKEYDMLMALPYSPSDIAAAKFLYMYIKSMPWYISLSGAMMISYGIFAKPSVTAYFLWIILTAVVPIIPTLCATLLGSLITAISTRFRKTNIVQTVLLLLVVAASIGSRFIMEAIFKNNDIEVLLGKLADNVDGVTGWYIPARWFSNAVREFNLLDALILVILSVLLFVAMFAVVGRYYRNINSALKSHATAKKYKMTRGKKNSVVNAIVFKEYRRMISSSNYIVNVCVGEFIAIVLGIAVLIAGFDKVIAVITENAPIQTEMLYPAIPMIVYFLVGMISSTTCSPSLEGKNYWIVQSLPISGKTLYLGKMKFNMLLMTPVSLFTTLCLCISAHTPILNAVLYMLQSFLLCCFATTWGCVCGLKFIKLKWENELEVIKQGAAVAVYMFPNMFINIGILVLVVFLGTKMNQNIVTLILMAIQLVLVIISYMIVMAMADKRIED